MGIPADKTFRCSYVHLSPAEQIGLHQQPTWELSCVIKGCGMRLLGDVSEPFKSGEVILIPPEISHCWYFNEEETDSRGKIINVTLEINQELLDNCQHLFEPLSPFIENICQCQKPISFVGSKKEALSQLLIQMSGQNRAEQIPTLFQILLLIADNQDERLIEIGQTIPKDDIRLEQVKTYIICNASRNIRLDDIVSHLGMNRASFCAFFKQKTGKTFINYLNDYRIDLACRELRKKEKSISEICNHVGFNDIPYFNRVFKRQMGCSPHEYQNKSNKQ